MIAYFIQVHDGLPYLEWMLPLIWDPANTYVISVDGDSEFYLSVETLTRDRSNVIVIRSSPVVWGGSTVVTSILRGMAIALERGAWDHLINISGRDLPIQSQKGMSQCLSNFAQNGKRNFIGYFGGVWTKWLPPEPAKTPSLLRRSRSYPALHGSEEMITCLESARSPVMDWTIRPNYFCVENLLTKTVTVRGLTEVELALQKEIFKDRIAFRAGRQWFVFGRSLCEWIIGAETTIEHLDYFRTIMIPDESFFQSLLERAPVYERDAIVPSNLRFREGDPVWLNDDFIPEIQASSALFGRKLQWDSSGALRNLVAARMK